MVFSCHPEKLPGHLLLKDQRRKERREHRRKMMVVLRKRKMVSFGPLPPGPYNPSPGSTTRMKLHNIKVFGYDGVKDFKARGDIL